MVAKCGKKNPTSCRNIKWHQYSRSFSDIKDELPCVSQQFPPQVFKYDTENEDACPSRKLNTNASTALT